MDVTTEWCWEGNVVKAIASNLAANGWTVVSKADTHTKEPGVDIHAAKDGQALLVEVKGFPSKFYRDPRRAGEHKPTPPTNQAQQWYSHALLKAMRLQAKHPDAIVALGFPELGVAFLTVRENGEVDAWGL